MVDSDIRAHMLRTYVWLRRMMVIVTALFLLALLWHRVFGSGTDPNSISEYYYHAAAGCPLKQLFIATLSTVGVLLIVYQGYTDGENMLLNVAGYGLLGVVFFPMNAPDGTNSNALRNALHYASALIFFGCIAVVSLWHSGNTLSLVSPQVRSRYKRAYGITGLVMVVLPTTTVVLGVAFHLTSTIFWLEVAGVVAFLAYWVVKSIELRMTQLETRNRVDELPR